MRDNPFPVMHGSMWKEPQTLEECEEIECNECAYNDGWLDTISRSGVEYCQHYKLLRRVEELNK